MVLYPSLQFFPHLAGGGLILLVQDQSAIDLSFTERNAVDVPFFELLNGFPALLWKIGPCIEAFYLFQNCCAEPFFLLDNWTFSPYGEGPSFSSKSLSIPTISPPVVPSLPARGCSSSWKSPVPGACYFHRHRGDFSCLSGVRFFRIDDPLLVFSLSCWREPRGRTQWVFFFADFGAHLDCRRRGHGPVFFFCW